MYALRIGALDRPTRPKYPLLTEYERVQPRRVQPRRAQTRRRLRTSRHARTHTPRPLVVDRSIGPTLSSIVACPWSCAWLDPRSIDRRRRLLELSRAVRIPVFNRAARLGCNNRSPPPTASSWSVGGIFPFKQSSAGRCPGREYGRQGASDTIETLLGLPRPNGTTPWPDPASRISLSTRTGDLAASTRDESECVPPRRRPCCRPSRPSKGEKDGGPRTAAPAAAAALLPRPVGRGAGGRLPAGAAHQNSLAPRMRPGYV